MSSRTKGNAYELKSRKMLEKDGYLVEKANARILWIGGRPISKHHDFFGLFDLIAVNSQEVRFIQVKFLDEESHGWLSSVRHEIAGFPVKSELWIWRKIGGRVRLGIEVL
jgi:Holliday junction resolvase-like predicted endonuclease